jgi:predicted component of type VI protein secretion system
MRVGTIEAHFRTNALLIEEQDLFRKLLITILDTSKNQTVREYKKSEMRLSLCRDIF